MDQKEMTKQLIADQLCMIIRAYTMPDELKRFIGDGIKNGDRIRIIVEVTLTDGFPTFKGMEFRVREDKT